MKKIFILLFLFPSFLIGMEDDQQITQISPWYSAPSEIRRAIAFHMPWTDLQSFGQTNHANYAITKGIIQNLGNMVSIVEKTYDIKINRSSLIHIPGQPSFSAICYENKAPEIKLAILIRYNADDNKNTYMRPLRHVGEDEKTLTASWDAKCNIAKTQLLISHFYKHYGSMPDWRRIIHVDETQKAYYITYPIKSDIPNIDIHEDGAFGIAPEEKSYLLIKSIGNLKEQIYNLNIIAFDEVIPIHTNDYNKAIKYLPLFAQAIYSGKEPHVTENKRKEDKYSCTLYHTTHTHNGYAPHSAIKSVTDYSPSAHGSWNKNFMETLKMCIDVVGNSYISCIPRSYKQLAEMAAAFCIGGNKGYAATTRNVLLEDFKYRFPNGLSCDFENELSKIYTVKYTPINIHNTNTSPSAYEARLPLRKLQNAFYGIKNPDGSIYKDIPTLLQAALCKNSEK